MSTADTTTPASPPESVSTPPPRRPRRHFLRWILLGSALFFLLWAVASSNPMAQGLREMVGDKHDQTVIAKPFSVSAGAFRYYKFDLPQGSTNVALVGQFAATIDLSKSGTVKQATQKPTSTEAGIDLYVLTEPGFAVWQKGYEASPVYDSGRVAQADVQVDLPNGAGVYYLVFSNKFPAATAQNVNATLMLHYKSWIPDWIRQIPGHFE